MLSFLKTVLFRDSVVPNPLYTTREGHPQLLVWLETVATDQEGRIMYNYGCRHSLLLLTKGSEREEAGLLAKGERHTGVTNLSSEVQCLAGEIWCDSFIDHEPQNDSQLLVVGGILKSFSLTSCLPEAVPHIRQCPESEVLHLSSGYKVHRIPSPLYGD